MRRVSKPSLVVFVFVFLFLVASLQAGEPGDVGLTILHINDFHGRVLPSLEKSIDEKVQVGGAAYLARMIGDRRAGDPEGTILLSAGDMFQGSPVSNIFRGEPVIEIMNYLAFDAMAIGNHEFDWGLDVLERLRASAAFPFLSANIEHREGRSLSGMKPYILLERKGMKIAVIGISTPETAYTTKPDIVKDLVFLDPEKVLPGLISEVRRKGAKLVIVLSHLGFDADKKLAEAVQGIDLIVGGHSHTAVTDPPKVGKTIVVQAGYYGYYLGVLEVRIDPETGSVTEYTTAKELKTVFAGPEEGFDERVDRIVARYNDRLKESFSETVGETSVDLVRNYNEESNIGNLITDAMRERAGADIAFASSGGIRMDIPAGKITREQVFGLLPFDNVLITVDLAGGQIREVLEQSAALEIGVLQVSGLRAVYDMKKPKGSRVIGVFVGDRPLDPGKLYRVVINDFLAAGGDRYTTFKEGKNAVYGDLLRDVFISYLRRHSPVSPKVEGRTVIVNPYPAGTPR